MRLCLLLFAASLSARAGPMALRTQGTIRELFLDMPLFDARQPTRPQLDVRYSVANTWNEPMLLRSGAGDPIAQTLDEQADSLQLTFRFPWRGRFSTALELRATEHWGGWSDGPIEAWHGFSGAFNYQRAQFPRDRVQLILADPRTTAFDVESGTFSLNDFTVRNQALLWTAGPYALAARLDLKLPIGSLARAGSSGSLDAGLGLAGTAELAPWATLHAMVALSRWGHFSAPLLLQPRALHFDGEASLELTFAGWSFYLEDRALSPIFPAGFTRDPVPVGDDPLLSSGLYADFLTHNQVSLGARYRGVLFWFSEDVTPGPNPHSTLRWLWVSNAPDVCIGLAYIRDL